MLASSLRLTHTSEIRICSLCMYVHIWLHASIQNEVQPFLVFPELSVTLQGQNYFYNHTKTTSPARLTRILSLVFYDLGYLTPGLLSVLHII